MPATICGWQGWRKGQGQRLGAWAASERGSGPGRLHPLVALETPECLTCLQGQPPARTRTTRSSRGASCLTVPPPWSPVSQRSRPTRRGPASSTNTPPPPQAPPHMPRPRPPRPRPAPTRRGGPPMHQDPPLPPRPRPGACSCSPCAPVPPAGSSLLCCAPGLPLLSPAVPAHPGLGCAPGTAR